MSDYWARRAKERMDGYYDDLEVYQKRIEQAVRGATGRIKADVEKILKNFMNRYKLTKEEAMELMNAPVDYESLQRMMKTVEKMPESADKKAIEAQIEAKAYGYRISKLEALEIDIKAETHRLADKIVEITGDSLRHTANKALTTHRADMVKLLKESGISAQFGGVNPKIVDELVKNSWSGKSFSARTWSNRAVLEKNLNSVLKEGILTGKGSYRIAEELEEKMNQGLYAAERLVRTETTHITNAADQVAYKEAGIEEYEYLAALDERTSKICQELNGKRFKVVDAQAGVNLPPMHPNCRSTTVAVLDDEVAEHERSVKQGKEAIHVDFKYIKSQAYRMKFHGISGNTKVDDKLCQYTIEILERRSGSFGEDLILVNRKTGSKIYELTTSTSIAAVDYDAGIKAAMKKAEKKGIEIIAIHNHPTGYPPTADDCVSAKIRGFYKGIAAGNNGNLYTYEPSLVELGTRACEDIHLSIALQVEGKVDPDVIDKIWADVLELNELKIEKR